MTDHFANDPFRLSHAVNVLALAGVCAILLFAFAWQLLYDELPCPLCLLQRAAFVLAGLGLLLNVRFGPAPMHYGLVIISALGGVIASGRQMLSHIAPTDPGYGSPFLGVHFYTWAVIAFAAMITYCAIMLIAGKANDAIQADKLMQARRTGLAAKTVMWLFLILVLGNMVSTLLECGFGACADNPVRYLWLSR